MVLLAYSMTLLHLRHSHVWIPARGWLGYLIQSPAHHQISSLREPEPLQQESRLRPFAVGLGFATLCIPKKHEALEFGLGAESHEHNGVLKVLVAAVRQGRRRLRRAGWFPTNARNEPLPYTNGIAATCSLKAGRCSMPANQRSRFSSFDSGIRRRKR